MSAAAFEVSAEQLVDGAGGRMVEPFEPFPSPVEVEGNKVPGQSSERGNGLLEVGEGPGKDNTDAGTASVPMAGRIEEGTRPYWRVP
jgi:hypothetical protein